jgi:hypothetical protein
VHDTQLQWFENLLAQTPEDRLVVMAHHGPLLSFYSAGSRQHQDDATAQIHALLEGREALSLSGHLHTLENIAPGEAFAGWQEALGVSDAPFRHIVAGAASGHWWQGDLALDGDSMALQRMGAPKGLLMLDFNGADYEERYVGSRIDPRRGQWVDFNTPAFRCPSFTRPPASSPASPTSVIPSHAPARSSPSTVQKPSANSSPRKNPSVPACWTFLPSARWICAIARSTPSPNWTNP